MLATSQHGKITYFFASGGHFAGAVYQGHRCIAHKTFHRCAHYYHFPTALLLIYFCFTADTSSEQRRVRARLPATRAERLPSQLGQACGDTTRRCSRFYYSVYLLYWYKSTNADTEAAPARNRRAPQVVESRDRRIRAHIRACLHRALREP
jgi:hypothetical protein